MALADVLLTVALLQTGCTGPRGGASMREPMLTQLEALDSEEFWMPTYIESGWNTVHDVLVESEQIRWLAAHPDVSVPEIIERIHTRLIHPKVLVAYFVVLEQAGDRRAVNVLSEYVENIEDGAANSVESSWHPFIYAVKALDRLTSLGLFDGRSLPGASDFFYRRKEIAKQARDKLSRRPDK